MNHIVITVALLSLTPGAIAQAPTDGAVVEQYSGSDALPDPVAYGQFLALIARDDSAGASDDFALHLVAEALGYEAHGADGGRLRGRLEFLRARERALGLERLEAQIGLLCAPGLGARPPVEQYHDALAAADEVRAAVRAKHLAITRQALPPSEREAFDAYLERLKGNISYVRVDTRRLETPGGADIVALAEHACEGYAARYQAMTEELP